MAHMAGVILAILMCAVLSRRIRVPNSRSEQEYAKSADGSAEDDGDGAADKLPAPVADTEAEGLQLHMSATSNSGYLGVFYMVNYNGKNKFKLNYKGQYLGCFATAVEAAVAYAKAAQGSAEEEATAAELAVVAANALAGALYDPGNGTNLASTSQSDDQGASNRARLEVASVAYARPSWRTFETARPSQVVENRLLQQLHREQLEVAPATPRFRNLTLPHQYDSTLERSPQMPANTNATKGKDKERIMPMIPLGRGRRGGGSGRGGAAISPRAESSAVTHAGQGSAVTHPGQDLAKWQWGGSEGRGDAAIAPRAESGAVTHPGQNWERLTAKIHEAQQAKPANARQAIEEALEAFKSSNLPYHDAWRRLEKVFWTNNANINQAQRDSLRTKFREVQQAQEAKQQKAYAGQAIQAIEVAPRAESGAVTLPGQGGAVTHHGRDWERQTAKILRQRQAIQAIEDALEAFKSLHVPIHDAWKQFGDVFETAGQLSRPEFEGLEADFLRTFGKSPRGLEADLQKEYHDVWRRLEKVFLTNRANINQAQRDSLMTKIWEEATKANRKRWAIKQRWEAEVHKRQRST